MLIYAYNFYLIFLLISFCSILYRRAYLTDMAKLKEMIHFILVGLIFPLWTFPGILLILFKLIKNISIFAENINLLILDKFVGRIIANIENLSSYLTVHIFYRRLLKK